MYIHYVHTYVHDVLVSVRRTTRHCFVVQYKPQHRHVHDVTRPTKQPGYHVKLRCNPYLYQGQTITYFLHIGGPSHKTTYKELEPHSPRSGQDLRNFPLIRSHLDGNASGWSHYCRLLDIMPDLQRIWLAVSERRLGVAMSLNLGRGAYRAI